MKDRTLVWLIGLLAVVTNIAIGLCSYYYVTRHQAELDRKSIEKIDIELKNLPKKDELQINYLEKSIELIQRNMIKLDDKTDRILETLSIEEKKNVINVIDRENIKDIHPAIDRKVDMNYIADNKILYKIDIKNVGKYPIIIKDNRKAILSTSKIISLNKNTNQLLVNKDYKLENMGFPIGNINITQGEEISQKNIIELITPEKIPDIIYYYISFEVETDPIIINSLNRLKLNKDEIDKITHKTYITSGTINKIK